MGNSLLLPAFFGDVAATHNPFPAAFIDYAPRRNVVVYHGFDDGNAEQASSWSWAADTPRHWVAVPNNIVTHFVSNLVAVLYA
jgi:hypothetical protein